MMQKFAVPSIFLMILGFASWTLSAPKNTESDHQAEVQAVLMGQIDAWNRGDLEGYMAGYWKSPDLVFFSNGSETLGWQPTLDRYRSRYQGAGKEMGNLDFPQMEIVMLGPESAMARGRWH